MAIYIVSIIAVLIIFMVIRNEFVYRAHRKIVDAISDYQMYQIAAHNYDFLVEFDDVEDYAATMLRFWDWGYTRLLPPEKFEVIQLYIEDKKE